MKIREGYLLTVVLIMNYKGTMDDCKSGIPTTGAQ